jgi:glycosyltransferase involved in cell wall biosynthesis
MISANVPRRISSPKKIQRLCYVSGQPAEKDAESWYLSGYSLRIVYYPTAYFPDVTLVAPLASAGTVPDGRNRVSVSQLENMRVRVLPAPNFRPLRWLRQWPVLWDCIGKADLVCANIPEESGFLAAVICKFRKKPLLVQVLGDWRIATLFAGRPGIVRTTKSWFGEFMTRVTVRVADLVFTQGQTLFQKCASLNPGATQSAMVHSTVTEGTFFEGNAARFHEPLRILTVCRLEPGKGLEVLAKSLQNLLNRGLEFEWWCVGQGPSEQALKDLTKSLKISESVNFTGYAHHGPDLFKFYRQADIFVLPSFHEGIPNAVLEAMAHSMPIVASDVGSLRQVITDQVEGVLIPAGEPGLLADAISWLAQDPDSAKLMGRAAYRRVQDYRAGTWSHLHRSLIEAVFGPIETTEPSRVSSASIPSRTEEVYSIGNGLDD